MQLDDYVRRWTEQLTALTALADDRTRQLATTLGDAGAAAARLVLLDALTAAAAEITEGLLDQPGSPTVAVRLDAGQVRLDVCANAALDAPAARAEDNDANARITLRLSERLKGDLDTAAERDGVSTNAWIVRALTAVVSRGAGGVVNPSRVSGWINS